MDEVLASVFEPDPTVHELQHTQPSTRLVGRGLEPQLTSRTSVMSGSQSRFTSIR